MCPTFTPDTHQSNIESPSRRAELAHSLIASVDSETVGKLEQWEQPSQAAPAFVFEVEQFCRRNFSRKFGSARGMPPGRYLASLRLDEAKRMLSHGGHTVKEVAEQCGYGDANYFCKVFRRSFGVSPGTLRYGSS